MIPFDELCAALDRFRGVASAPPPASARAPEPAYEPEQPAEQQHTLLGAEMPPEVAQAAGGDPEPSSEIDLDEVGVDEVS